MLLRGTTHLVPTSLQRFTTTSSSSSRSRVVTCLVLLRPCPQYNQQLVQHTSNIVNVDVCNHKAINLRTICLAGRRSNSSYSSSSSSSSSDKSSSTGNRHQKGTTQINRSNSKLASESPQQQKQQSRGGPQNRSGKGQQQQNPKTPASKPAGTAGKHPTSSSNAASSSFRSPSSPSNSQQYKQYKPNSSSSSSSSSSFSSAPKSSPIPRSVQLLVVGGGAAGLTAAYFAAKAGAQVCVLERTREAGKKILMSGGSRCNVLPLEVDMNLDYVTSSSASALRAVFASWSLQQCQEWLSRDVGLRLLLEEETNKWFPASNSSREVRDRLVAACEQLGVSFVYNASVEQITPPTPPGVTTPAQQPYNHNDAATGSDSSGSSSSIIGSGSSSSSISSSSTSWRVALASGASVSAERIIMSTGGRSFPAVGTDGTGLNLLQGLGHKLVPQYAALTPLKGPHPGGQQLAGLTLSSVRLTATKPAAASGKASAKAVAVAQRGGLLFTHKGYSGPAILDLSHWLVREMEQQQQPSAMPRLLVDWSGEGLEVWQQRLAAASGATTVEALLRKSGIKDRLASALAVELGVAGRPLSQLKKGEREALLAALTAWPLPVTGHEGYKKAEVTGGGVVLEQVDCRTMESRLLPGLHLCGEVLDVFGRIGGFNFYWAWVTGRMAGVGAAATLSAPKAAAAAAGQR